MNTYACMCVSIFWNQKSIREQNPILVTNICAFEEILKNSQETQQKDSEAIGPEEMKSIKNKLTNRETRWKDSKTFIWQKGHVQT